MKRSKLIGFCACLSVVAIVGQAWAQQSTTTTKPSANTTPHAQTPAGPATTPATTPASTATTTSPSATKSLYDRLGGEKAITGITNDFVDRVLKDPKVTFTHQGTTKQWLATPANVTSLKHSVSQYLGMATGGPQKYDGKDLKTAHEGIQITAAEFDSMSADMSASLDHLNVAKPEHADMMKIVSGLKNQIVEPSKTPTVTPTAVTTHAGSKR